MTRNSSGCIGSCRSSSKATQATTRVWRKPPTSWPALAEQAYASGEVMPGEVAHDDLPFDLLDALAVESDPRAERLLDLMRERGWTGWTRLERLAEPPD